MNRKRSSKPPEKLTAKVYVLVKYVKDGIYDILDSKDVRFSEDDKQCTALWRPNKTFYPAIIVNKHDDKDHLQKLKAKINKQEKVAKAQDTQGISKGTEKQQTDNSAKRKLAVNELLEEADEDTEDEDEASYRRYLERTREISKKKKASQKKAVNTAKNYRQMAAYLAEPQDKRLKATSQLESDDDDDIEEVPFIGEDLASLSNTKSLERENKELKKMLMELKGKKVTKEVPTTVHVDVDKTTDTDKLRAAEPGEYGDINVARKLNLVPLVPGSNVFLSPSKLATAGNGVSSPTILTYNLLRVFFKKEIIMISNYKGGGTAGYKALNPTITNAIIGYVKIKMPQIKTSVITQAINSYCTRIRNQLKIKKEPQEG